MMRLEKFCFLDDKAIIDNHKKKRQSLLGLQKSCAIVTLAILS